MNDTGTLEYIDIPAPHGLSKTCFTSWDGSRLRVDVRYCADTSHAVVLLLPIGVAAHPLLPLISVLGNWATVYVLYSRFVLDPAITLDPDSRIDASAHSKDVTALAEHFDLSDFGIFGYCTGALIAFRSAFLLPEQAKAIVCCSGAFELSQRTEYERELVELVSACAGQRRTARAVRRVVSAKQDSSAEFHEHTSLALRDDETFYKYATCLQAMYDEGLSGIEGRIDTPALLIAGSRDEIVSPENSYLPRPYLANSELRILEGEDHYLPCRPGSRSLDIIDDFLRTRLKVTAE